MKTASIFSLCLAILPFVTGQTTKACDPKTDVCFHQLFDTATNTTVGLIFPKSGTEDVIVKLTTSLPYGYVGFGFSAPGENLPEYGLVGWVKVIKPRRALRRSPPKGPVSTLPSGLLTQQSILTTDVSTPSAGPAGNTVVTTSPDSSTSYDKDSITFFFRCQQCFATSTFKPGDRLTIFRSATSNAPLADFTVTHVPIGSIDVFRDSEFSSFAKRLELD